MQIIKRTLTLILTKEVKIINNKVIREIILAVIHAAEEAFGRKITTEERSRFNGFLSGEGGGIEFLGTCGKKVLSAQRRGEWLYFRVALDRAAAGNGCIEKSKQWAEAAERAVSNICKGLGMNRERLTVRHFVVIDRGENMPPELIHEPLPLQK